MKLDSADGVRGLMIAFGVVGYGLLAKAGAPEGQVLTPGALLLLGAVFQIVLVAMTKLGIAAEMRSVGELIADGLTVGLFAIVPRGVIRSVLALQATA